MKKKIFIFLILLFVCTIAKAESCYYENHEHVEIECSLYNELLNYYPENFLNYMTQDEFDQFKNNDPSEIEVTTLNDGLLSRGAYYGTTYKEIRLIKSGNFITAILAWKLNPKVRSYDVFAVRTSGTSINGTVSFKQLYDVGGSTYYSTSCSKKNFSNGIGVSFQLSVYSNIQVILTFSVTGSGTVYSSYQHATETVTLAQSKLYTLSSLGYGGTTLFDSSVSSKYDGMNGVNISV